MKKEQMDALFGRESVPKIFRIMKLLGLFLLGGFMQVSANIYSQTANIALNMKDASLKEVIQEIQRQTEFDFFYSPEDIQDVRVSKIDVQKASLEKTLDLCLQGTGLTYDIVHKAVIINRIEKPMKALPWELNEQQQKSISGKVTDSSGTPLPGVTVVVKGTTQGIITDADGNYSLVKVSGDATLAFSFVGMETQEIPVSGRVKIDVVMVESTIGIEEVVAIGYGSVKKSDLTGSVGNVEVKSLSKAPVGAFTEALAGRVAGLQASAPSGQPGVDLDIRIRGTGSLTQNTSPLFVIDGFPVESFDPSSLNPEEIETMTVLKDASSTAIYGSRASNGVILINTKRGIVSKPVITVNVSSGFQNNWKRMEVMSPYEFVKYINELHPTQTYAKQYLENGRTLDYYRDVKGIDWTDQVFQTGRLDIYNLAIRGGTMDTKYSISGSYYDQKGIIINTGMKRFNGRITLDQNISSKLKVGLTVNYSGVDTYGMSASAIASTNISSTVLFRTWVYRPIAPDDAGTEELLNSAADEDAIYGGDIRVNPFIDLNNQHQVNNTGLTEANAYASYEILNGLTLKVTGGVRQSISQNERFYNSKTAQGNPLNPNNLNGIWGSLSTGNSKSWVNEYILTYDKKFGEDHSLKGLGLFGMNKSVSYGNGYSSKLLPNESLGIKGMDEGIPFDPSSYYSENTMSSYATRWDYSYKLKYILSATFRADGSSKFSSKNRWGYFPGIALAWNMEKEDFFKKTFPFISNSKLRVSYGTNGNNRVGNFVRFASLEQSLNGYSYNNQTPTDAVYVSSMANDDLKWEKTTKLDIGYEIGFFEKRINLEVDLYRNTTTDLLLNAPLPPTTGFSKTMKNVGILKNEGLEITLNTINVQTHTFRWTSNFNISFNKNKIIELTRGQENLTYNVSYEGQYNTPLYISEVGGPSGMMYGYVWDGNYQYEDFDNPAPGKYILKSSVPSNGMARASIQPGDIKYKDFNGDLVVNSYDKTIIGRGQPIHVGGFQNNLVYKQFSLNIFFQWSYGNNIFNANRLSLEGNSNSRINMNQFASYADRWTPENQDSKNFRAGGPGPVGYYSSKVVEDGSYLRLKTVSLEYSLPKQICNKMFMRDLVLNISGQNLLTLTNYSGLDPEVSISGNRTLGPGFDFSAYPQSQTIVVGIKATF